MYEEWAMSILFPLQSMPDRVSLRLEKQSNQVGDLVHISQDVLLDLLLLAISSTTGYGLLKKRRPWIV